MTRDDWAGENDLGGRGDDKGPGDIHWKASVRFKAQKLWVSFFYPPFIFAAKENRKYLIFLFYLMNWILA